MFNSNKDFFPTPHHVIEQMMEGEIIKGKKFLEPECGKCDIVDYLHNHGAESVIACELNEDLRKIAATKCKLIGTDFLQVTSDQVSHIDHIVMNPPFSADEKHILHAYEIAPAGCRITALCALGTLENGYSRSRKTLISIIDTYGTFVDIGNCFDIAERKTNVKVALVKIIKPGGTTDSEFEGFLCQMIPLKNKRMG